MILISRAGSARPWILEVPAHVMIRNVHVYITNIAYILHDALSRLLVDRRVLTNYIEKDMNML